MMHVSFDVDDITEEGSVNGFDCDSTPVTAGKILNGRPKLM